MTIACPPARVRSLAQEVCGAEDLTGHGPFGSVSGDVSLLVRYARVSLEIWLGLAWQGAKSLAVKIPE